MLLAIPTILAAGVLAVKDAIEVGDMAQINDMLIGAGLSFFAAIVAIHFLMRWLQTASMTIFVVYRVLLGIGLFAWIYIG
jgi:undecaprenyl-diphosphatase